MIKWQDFEFTVGMPHMVPGKLSEVELLKILGACQWDSISTLLGQRSNQIVNALDERLYASFINIELHFQNNQGQDDFDEGARVYVKNGVTVYAKKFIEGFSVFGASPIAGETVANISKREDLLQSEYSWAYLTNAFVTRAAGNSKLKVFEPQAMKTREIPAVDVLPAGIAEHEKVQFSGKIEGYAPSEQLIRLSVKNTDAIQYKILPESDLNGAGLLYFARYVAMMNYAERVFLTERMFPPLSTQLVFSLSTESRKLFYFANADPNDVVNILVRGTVIRDNAGLHQSKGKQRPPITFIFEFTLYRASDNNLMAISSVRKSLKIPGSEKSLLAEAARFTAQFSHGL
jgi:probable biosynthetic protein (TIGR04098 family)